MFVQYVYLTQQAVSRWDGVPLGTVCPFNLRVDLGLHKKPWIGIMNAIIPTQPPPQNQDIYFTYVDQIDVAKVNLAISVIQQQILTKHPKRLFLLLSSPGGDVSSGIALFNYLRALPIEIVTYNIGMIASIANVVFMAAESKNRFACPHTSFLFHGVKLNLSMGMQVDISQVKELESSLARDQERITEIYLSTTSLKKEQIDALFKQGEIRDLNTAVKEGIIAKVEPLKIPPDAIQITFALPISYIRQN